MGSIWCGWNDLEMVLEADVTQSDSGTEVETRAWRASMHTGTVKDKRWSGFPAAVVAQAGCVTGCCPTDKMTLLNGR